MHIFKTGIKPVWEDESLTDGSRFTMKLQKTHTSKYWEDLLLALIGENLGAEDLVAGLVMNLKPQSDKISIWIADSTKTEEIAQLKE